MRFSEMLIRVAKFKTAFRKISEVWYLIGDDTEDLRKPLNKLARRILTRELGKEWAKRFIEALPPNVDQSLPRLGAECDYMVGWVSALLESTVPPLDIEFRAST